MPNGIPEKGKILTALSLFWFDWLKDVENHLITADVRDYPKQLAPFTQQIAGRSMLVKKAAVVPIECVARGYITGSGWKDYLASGATSGVKLPAGLRQCDKLSEPIFTPATKAESGHDINIPIDQAAKDVGADVMSELRQRTLGIYKRAADYAAARGVIIADTKFEFGRLTDGKLILVDEILTPDSSRFWPADKYEPGHDQESFDKQFVRNWLETQPWDKTPPAPRLPEHVVAGTRARYLEAYEKLTGKQFG
jgi:phosphoribosylaminoimidazole-succinocarboxamide synthase